MKLERPGLFYLVSTFCLVVRNTESVITCDAPLAAKGDPASVTCHFDFDVTEEQKSFVIQKYDVGGKFEHEALNCHWLGGKHQCDVTDGYTFDGSASSTAVLDIKSADETFEGKYVCQVIPSDRRGLTPCFLNLFEKSTTVVISSPAFTDIQTSLSSAGQTESDKEIGFQLLPVLLPVIIILLAATVVGTLIVLRKKGYRFQSCRLLKQKGKSALQEQEVPLSENSMNGQKTEEITRNIHEVCKEGDTETLRKLLRSGTGVDSSDEDEKTPLHVACEHGQDAIVDILLEHNPNIEAKDDEGATALRLACEKGREAIVEKLIQGNADVNTQKQDGTTPLHAACQTGKGRGILEVLLQKGASIEAKDETGKTPLHWACKNDREECVEYLLEKEGDVNATDNNDWTPLHFACQIGNKNIMEMLCKNKADVSARTASELKPKHLAKQHEHHMELLEVLKRYKESKFSKLLRTSVKMGRAVMSSRHDLVALEPTDV